MNKEMRHLRAALKWALRREYIERVPDFTGAFIRVDEKQPVTIPEDDSMAMVKALEKPDIALRRRGVGWWKAFLYIATISGCVAGRSWN